MASSLHSNRYQIFRELLVKAREEAHLTQVQVAELLGKPQSFVSKYERGERRLDFCEFLELAAHLNFDAGKFVAEYQQKLTNWSLPG